MIYGGAGHDCNVMTRENRESVIVHPFSTFAGDFAMCQIIFSGSGFHSHVYASAVAEKIKNLLIAASEAGSFTGETLLRAYQFLTSIIKENKQNIGRSV